MDDTVSRTSIDSISSGGEFVVVQAEPRLRIPGNGDTVELEKKLSEVLEDDSMPASGEQPDVVPDGEIPKVMTKSVSKDRVAINLPDKKPGPLLSPMDDEDGTVVFTGVTYLGSATVNAPRSETEISRNMAVLNEQTQMVIPVTLSVPATSEGTVRVIDPVGNTEIASYRIHHILFCARGPSDSEERRCFAFTCSHGESAETAIFQCHVFRCDAPDVVGKILYSFATAFRRVPKSPSSQSELSQSADAMTFHFDVSLEFKEDDGKGNFSTVPKDKNVFKLRKDVEKKLCISVTQVTNNKELKIERCFGLLLSPGRNVKHSDMHLIDMVSMGADGRSYAISGQWDPCDPSFQILNTETPKDMRVFLTIAVDLVVEGIQEPVRFLIETKAKIFPANERFWYFSKKPHHEQFVLKLREIESSEDAEVKLGDYEVVSIDSQTDIDRKKSGLSLSLSPSRIPPQNIQTPNGPEDESDNDEPLLSGSGAVSKDVTDEELLESWAEVLNKWHGNLKQRPKQVHALCRKGVPEALRGEVWQLLAGCHDNADMLENYRILITKDTPNDHVIMRDINRTFPAHDFFRETDGLGQESLLVITKDSSFERVIVRDLNRTFPAHEYFKDAGGVGQDSLCKLSKAYSVYDEEVGYCQGLSFVAAALLLHMPEEQAFCVLVKMMFDYGLRDLFKQGFEELHLRFYQLERLMQDQMPDLFEHFMELGLEAHMFASQWFLTLFTAKFPLFMVFHILDIFLSEGKEVTFNVALALLKTSRKELLALDFEGVLKFFRVQLPKKYRMQEHSQDLLSTAVSIKVQSKKLKKYEKEYVAMKEAQMQQEDPVERFERENKRLLEANMRLEQENDDLAYELVTSKIALRNDLDNAEDNCDSLSKELLQTKTSLVEVEEEKRRLEGEAAQLKEMLRREHDSAEGENTRNQAIIGDYKQICSQLSERLEKQQAGNREELTRLKAQIQACDSCSKLFDGDGQYKKLDLPEPNEVDLNPLIAERDKQIRELELELAQTKLALVESECKTQDLTHQLNSALNELQTSKNTWFQKTISSIKEATVKKEGKEKDSGVKKESAKD